MRVSAGVLLQFLFMFIPFREAHKPPWPYVDHSCNRLNPFAEVSELVQLVECILAVFQDCTEAPLKEKWARIALQWATSCPSQLLASQSFQVCRALRLPLGKSMLRDMLTRLAEYASDQAEELQVSWRRNVCTFLCNIFAVNFTELCYGDSPDIGISY